MDPSSEAYDISRYLYISSSLQDYWMLHELDGGFYFEQTDSNGTPSNFFIVAGGGTSWTGANQWLDDAKSLT